MDVWGYGVMKVWKCWNGIGVCLFFRSVVRHSIVHRALLDFLTHCDHTSRSVSSVFFCVVVLLLMTFTLLLFTFLFTFSFEHLFLSCCDRCSLLLTMFTLLLFLLLFTGYDRPAERAPGGNAPHERWFQSHSSLSLARDTQGGIIHTVHV